MTVGVVPTDNDLDIDYLTKKLSLHLRTWETKVDFMCVPSKNCRKVGTERYHKLIRTLTQELKCRVEP